MSTVGAEGASENPEAQKGNDTARKRALARLNRANSRIESTIQQHRDELEASIDELRRETSGKHLLISGATRRIDGYIVDPEGAEDEPKRMAEKIKIPFTDLRTASIEFFVTAMHKRIMPGESEMSVEGEGLTIGWRAEVVDGSFRGDYVGTLDELRWVEAPEIEEQTEKILE